MQSLLEFKKIEVPVATVRRRVKIETKFGPAEFVAFGNLVDSKEHIALVFQGKKAGPPLVRIHSECLTGDVFGSARCDCGEQLEEAQKLMAVSGGVLLYLRQEGRGIGLYNKLDAYSLQDKGFNTFEANELIGFPKDGRTYSMAAQMLRALNVRGIRLLTNNPEKAAQLREDGIDVREIQRTSVFLNKDNRHYLEAKALSGHLLNLVETEDLK